MSLIIIIIGLYTSLAVHQLRQDVHCNLLRIELQYISVCVIYTNVKPIDDRRKKNEQQTRQAKCVHLSPAYIELVISLLYGTLSLYRVHYGKFISFDAAMLR